LRDRKWEELQRLRRDVNTSLENASGMNGSPGEDGLSNVENIPDVSHSLVSGACDIPIQGAEVIRGDRDVPNEWTCDTPSVHQYPQEVPSRKNSGSAPITTVAASTVLHSTPSTIGACVPSVRRTKSLDGISRVADWF
jgi:hypothetical protein